MKSMLKVALVGLMMVVPATGFAMEGSVATPVVPTVAPVASISPVQAGLIARLKDSVKSAAEVVKAKTVAGAKIVKDKTVAGANFAKEKTIAGYTKTVEAAKAHPYIACGVAAVVLVATAAVVYSYATSEDEEEMEESAA